MNLTHVCTHTYTHTTSKPSIYMWVNYICNFEGRDQRFTVLLIVSSLQLC